MFLQIFLFEIKYRLRRPAFYVYSLAVVVFIVLSFAKGALPVQEKEFINAPVVLALISSVMSLFLMLVSSAIMGVPLYRDIEHNTKEYYLSYPITKAGYFWGRYLGSFFFVLLTGLMIYPAAWLGCKLGPALGWNAAGRYGPDHFINYLYPYLTLVVPSLFFTSSFFFGLVAVFRNVKVIYSSGMFLFLGYMLSMFFMHLINNPRVIYLADPFLINGLRMTTQSYPPALLNSSVVHLRGLLLENRILWISVGAALLGLTYLRFSFERFFTGMSGQGLSRRRRGGKGAAEGNEAGHGLADKQHKTGLAPADRQQQVRPAPRVNLRGSYYRKTLFSLTRIELLNIIRDNYFWMILSGGLIFLSFIFWHGPGRFGGSDFPRTAFFLDVFNDDFSFFVFLIIIFYTGETVHREKLTRYAFINDALPPPTWVLNSAKLTSLCCLAVFLSLIPVVLGLAVQLLKGYHHFNFPLYFSTFFAVTLPKQIETVLFCYAIHITVNNKFAAHGIAITIWALLSILVEFNYFHYNLLLYAYTPSSVPSDMDGTGHMLRPVVWYNVYWSVAGFLLVVIGSLWYVRGVSGSFKEKAALARQRFSGVTRVGAWILVGAFLVAGGFIYYNVSYLNEYVTPAEKDLRAFLAETQLKRYADLPLPRVTRIQLYTDLYPEEQKELTRAYVTIMNTGNRPIDSLLLDGDNLADYRLIYNGVLLPYTCPLYFPRGKFNGFRSPKEPSDYRLYILPLPLLPGDTARVEVNSMIAYKGFQNGFYGGSHLHNGTFSTGGLPGMGYDDDEEIDNNDTRKKFGLPEKVEKDIPQDDPVAQRALANGRAGGLLHLDITVSTSGDQWAIAPGVLEKEWMSGGRHYFHYVQDHPQVYPPYGIASARYEILRDTVRPDGGLPVNVEIYYDPLDGLNRSRFMTALKDGLQYYSKAYGPYPLRQIRLIESSIYGPQTSTFTGTILFNERFDWNADPGSPGAMDYCYYDVAEQLAHQWWGGQVASNHTVGSHVIAEGLSKYSAMMMMGVRYGGGGIRQVMGIDNWDYDRNRMTDYRPQNDLLHANRWYQWGSKAAMVFHGLQGLIGEDSLNAALREFRDTFAFRNGGPYAGSPDLYRALQRHVPDSFRYYLQDSWEKVCLYDNKVVTAKAVPTGHADEYKVDLTVEVNKVYIDSRNEHPATTMNDYIDIGIFGAANAGSAKTGAAGAGVKGAGMGPSTLYKKRWRLTAGLHSFEFIVHGLPVKAVIDPDWLLIDPRQEDNRKDITDYPR